MLSIILQNHEETAAVGDIVRLFFGVIKPYANRFKIMGDCSGKITITTSENLAKDYVRSLVRQENLTYAAACPQKTLLKLQYTPANSENYAVTATKALTISEEVSLLKLRREIKRQLYRLLKTILDIDFPWGTLTGVRPTQVALEELQQLGFQPLTTKENVRPKEVALAELQQLGFQPLTTKENVRPDEVALAELQQLGFQPATAKEFVKDNAASKQNSNISPVGNGDSQTQNALVAMRAAALLQENWNVSEAKAKLAVRTSIFEEAILQKKIEEIKDAGDGAAQPYIVYVGLPFCPTRCSYCSFVSRDIRFQQKYLNAYVDAVIKETHAFFAKRRRPAAAIYFGGGTPTSLPNELFALYLQGVLAEIPRASYTELTMEAGRADTINEFKLREIKKHGFHKLCLNPQTMSDEILKKIGRNHSVQDVKDVFAMARSLGFDNINMDLIAGLKEDNSHNFLSSVAKVIAMAPENITIHTLSVKKGAYLHDEVAAGEVYKPESKLIAAVQASHDLLEQSGYVPYYLYRQKTIRSGLENTGFTKAFGSFYNVAMMSDRYDVVGLGSGASSKHVVNHNALRLHNPKDLLLYIQRIEQQIDKKLEFFAGAAQ